MHIDFTPEHRALRREIREYYQRLFTPELRARYDAEFEEMGGPVFQEIVGRMGRDGWLGIGWPEEHGGKGMSAIEQFIFWDETYRAKAPLPVIGVNTIGPTLMQYGSEAQKAELLPRIIRGEVFFGVGYTEPGAGTDLAALSTTAVEDGDDYVINGQKVFTTHANCAQYIWLAARTELNALFSEAIGLDEHSHLLLDEELDRRLSDHITRLVEDLRVRGRITDRPDDDALARMMVDEYVKFPRPARLGEQP